MTTVLVDEGDSFRRILGKSLASTKAVEGAG